MSLAIAVDGPAGSGKGSLCRMVSKRYSLHYLDTGLLYRAVALEMLRHNINPSAEQQAAEISQRITPKLLEDPELKSCLVSQTASKISTIKSVRDALLVWQRAFIERSPDVILDGRDIGTVVLPNADLKFFITASPEIRAQRRYQELVGYGTKNITVEGILLQIRERDQRDMLRDDSPLKAAEGATIIDTTALDQDHVFRIVCNTIDQYQVQHI